jgi:hypothetical protein
MISSVPIKVAVSISEDEFVPSSLCRRSRSGFTASRKEIL